MTSRPAQALVYLALLVGAPYALPERWSSLPLPGGGALDLRLLSPSRVASAPTPAAAEPEPPVAVGAVAVPETSDEAEPAPEEAPRQAFDRPRDEALPTAEDAARTLIDPSGKALAALYEAFGRVDAKEPGAVVRVAYYGDSVVAFDLVTSTLRRRLQARFGDAGRGFVLPINAWPGYYQHDVSRLSSGGWVASRVVGPLVPDGLYGLGGVSFRSESRAMAVVATARAGQHGRNASRFVVSYAAQPGGGELSLRVDGEAPTAVSTAADKVEVRAAEVRAADGPHRLEIQASKGPVRLFGVELLRDGPGAIVDALGIMSSRMYQLEQADEAGWASEIARVRPSLIALAVGINDVSDGVRGAKVFERHGEASGGMIKRVRDAAPWASCLIVGPLDRGAGPADPYTNRGVAELVNRRLRGLAAEHGCAYWDLFSLMGGAGGMASWVRNGLGSSDFMHPSPRGAQLLGDLLTDELLRRYERARAEGRR